MTDQDYYNAVRVLLDQSLKSMQKSKRFIPGKSDLIKGFKELIAKTDELKERGQ